jgi:tetratricopeptide (TPR) repeat protein
MHRLSAPTIATLVIIVVCGAFLGAQPQSALRAGSLRWYASIADADQLPEARSFRVYGTPDQLTVALVIANETTRPIAVNQEMFSHQVRFSVVGTSAVPIAVTWLPEAWWVAGALGPTPVLPDERFEVGASRTVEWRVAIRPTQADRFAGGQYLVKIELSDEMAARSTTHGTQLAVTTGLARSDDERAAEYLFLGRRALKDGRLLEARDYLQRARTANPATSVALFELAVAHLQLREYREAIATFEQLHPVREQSSIPGYLAEAYVGLGDDGRATQVLRRAGMSSRDIVSELDRLRRRVRP